MHANSHHSKSILAQNANTFVNKFMDSPTSFRNFFGVPNHSIFYGRVIVTTVVEVETSNVEVGSIF